MTAPGGSSEYRPQSLAAFENAVGLVERGIEQIRAEWGYLIDRINAYLDKVRKEVEDSSLFEIMYEAVWGDIKQNVETIKRMVETARAAVDKLLEQAQKSVAGSIPVASLFSRAYDLGERVNRPLTGMYGDMTGSGDIDFWRGPAKITYEKRVGDQQDAVTNASGKVKTLATYLGDAATANMTYMASLGDRLATILKTIITTGLDILALEAGALTQVIAALSHLSELIGTAVEQSIGYVTTLGTRIAEVLNQILALQTENSDLTGLTPDGRWPSPVAS
ncbi:hypothetical protein [Actinoplanes sp. NPDC049265]|uniref:hypothetical protein n=1 Tax=Actinoplanes sp. NPDC049265 TaxID=3363902 RepID=UPI00371FC2C8